MNIFLWYFGSSLQTASNQIFFYQKQESWIKPLIDSTVKEIKDKTAKFEGEFSKKDSKPKWFHKKDVGLNLCIFDKCYTIIKINLPRMSLLLLHPLEYTFLQSGNFQRFSA